MRTATAPDRAPEPLPGKSHRPIRIAYLIEQIVPGGAERQLLALIGGLDRSRFEPALITGSGSGFMMDEARALGIPIVVVDRRFGGGKLATFGAVREVMRFKPDILHSYAFAANTWASAARLLMRRTIQIAGARGVETELTRVHRMVDGVMRRVPDHIISNSHVHKNVLVGWGVDPTRVSVVPNGIDLSRFPWPSDRAAARKRLGLAPEAAMVGMIGSFRPLKRWDVFLRASAIVAKSHPIEVLCVGEGALQGEMHALAHSLGIRERTRFLGARNDVPDILAALDVMVSASDTEGLSNVILEAMAAARPVVATRVGGTPELVIDGVTGYLTPAGAVDAMADRITDVLSDLPGAKAMGAAGRRRAESEFSLSACVAATVAVYDAMLDAKRGRGHTARAPERHV